MRDDGEGEIERLWGEKESERWWGRERVRDGGGGRE